MEKVMLASAALLLLCALGATGADTSADMARLMSDLTRSYNPNVIPSTPLSVSAYLSLVNVLKVNRETNVVDLLVWVWIHWKDSSLSWNPEDYNNVTKIRIPAETVWRPDFHVYNSVRRSQSLSPQIVVVGHDGYVTIVPSKRVQIACDLKDVASADGAECKIELGSWTYSGLWLTLEKPVFQNEMEVEHPRYEVLEMTAERVEPKYEEFPEPYEHLEFAFTIRQRGARADSSDMTRLMADLMKSYNPNVIPSTPLEVSTGMNLINILDVDTEANLVELLVWPSAQWNDQRLRWDPAQYHNITSLHIPAPSLFRPDFFMYNSVNPVEMLTPMIAIVKNDGTILVYPSRRARFSCDLSNLASASGVECRMKVGSWTYSSYSITLKPSSFDLRMKVPHPKYEVVDLHTERNVRHYDCCPEPYEDVEFHFTIRHRDGHHH